MLLERAMEKTSTYLGSGAIQKALKETKTGVIWWSKKGHMSHPMREGEK